MNLEGKKLHWFSLASSSNMNLGKTAVILAVTMILFPVKLTNIFYIRTLKNLYIFGNYGSYWHTARSSNWLYCKETYTVIHCKHLN